MKRTGEILKKTREERGLSVHEVGLFLKINTRILQAIEEGDQSQLPAKTFLRGFVQSYAKFLKLDTAAVLHTFNEEMSPPSQSIVVPESNMSAPEPQKVASHHQTESDSQPEPTIESKTDQLNQSDVPLKDSILSKSFGAQDSMKIKTVAISVLGLLVVLFVYFANNVVKKYKREAEVSPDITAVSTGSLTSENTQGETAVTSIEENTSQNPVLVETPSPNTTPSLITSPESSASPMTSTPTTTPSAPLTNISAAPAVAPTPLPKPAQPAPPAPTPVSVAPTPAPKPVTPNPSPSLVPTTATAPATTTTPSTLAPVAEGKSVEVIVEAKDNVEIEYSSAKSTPQKILMKVDQIHTFKSRSGIRLKISNGGAVNVIVNGQDRGAPGAAGQSVQVSYD